MVDDIFSDFVDNPILKAKYGQEEINRAKEWIKNNKIQYSMKLVTDTEAFPQVTIAMGKSDEDDSLATLGDQDIDIETLDPSDIGQPIAFIVKPFQVANYEKTTGVITVPANLSGFQHVGADMVAIDPKTGNGFIIREKISATTFRIDIDSDLDVDELAIIPQYQIYRARRERIINQEQYNIGCHAHGDPMNTIFLFNLVKYAMLRYREGLFEYNNFQLSSIKCTDMIKNDAFQSENIYSRYIILTGQTEESWIKSPYRVIEAFELIEKGDALDTAGIKVCSNLPTVDGSEEEDNDLWVTIDEDA